MISNFGHRCSSWEEIIYMCCYWPKIGEVDEALVQSLSGMLLYKIIAENMK